MFIEKGKALITSAKDILGIFGEVNKIVRPIDPMIFRVTWIRAVVQGVMTLGFFAFVGTFVDQMVSGYISKEKVTMELFLVGVVGFSLFIFVRGTLAAYVDFREMVFDTELARRLEIVITEKLRTLDIGRLSDPEFVTLRESVQWRGKSAIGRIFDAQVSLISAIVGVTVAFAGVVFIDPILILIALIPFVPELLIGLSMNRKRVALWEDERFKRLQKNEYGRAVYQNQMVVQGRLLRFGDHMFRRYVDLSYSFKDSQDALHKVWLTRNLMLGVVKTVVLSVVLVYLGAYVVSGEFSFAKIFFVVGCLRAFSQAMGGFSHALSNIDESRMHYQYWDEFHKTEPLINERGVLSCKFAKTPSIELKEVSFGYPRKEDKLVLDKCSLSVPPGEKLAIVGRNGCGKTTILRLMTKTYVPISGDVLFDWQSTKEISQASLLDSVLCVTQGSEVPDLRIAEALTGEDPEWVNYERLRLAGEMSGTNEFVEKLSDGYLTQIGEEWLGGVGFSAGQLQRLKLAAAFYRLLDPEVRVALFDEPMSHCDVETRERFYSAIQAVTGKTIIVVLHDPLYLGYFERVVEVRDGFVANDIRGRRAIEGFRNEILLSLSKDLS